MRVYLQGWVKRQAHGGVQPDDLSVFLTRVQADAAAQCQHDLTANGQAQAGA